MMRVLGFVLLIGVALSIIGGLHYYFYLRLVRDLALSREWRLGTTTILVVLALSLPLAMILGRVLSSPWRELVSWPAFLWMGAMFLLFVLLVAGDFVRAAGTLTARLLYDQDLSDPSRRAFFARLLAGSALAGTLGLSGIAVGAALRTPRVRRVRVALSRLPQALDGFRLVQLTDLHVGETVGLRFVNEVVRQTNALHPDLVVITGDLVDGSAEELKDTVAPLGALVARHGVYFVTGNHEYYSGVGAWLAHLPTLGIRVLRNERVVIGDRADSFELAGVDDSSAARQTMTPGHGADVERAMAGVDPGREVVLLAHQPKEVHAAARHGVGLMLSGHTHGGQIWPFGYLVALTQPYMEGLHLHQSKTWIYVSRGTGYWGPPMRLCEPAEITHVTLTCDGPSEVDAEPNDA
ncbi:MAG: metallophosphoesterase [Deltaproteobacteria bacterium]|nr:metallophosphoesterase [Deltaproteobacteria bacterium]